jgi:hypothetical protein
MKLFDKLRARLRRNDPERAERLAEQAKLKLEREGRGLPGAETHGTPPDTFGVFP